jgi:hypothetical protein
VWKNLDRGASRSPALSELNCLHLILSLPGSPALGRELHIFGVMLLITFRKIA